jgi:hypothetical protein
MQVSLILQWFRNVLVEFAGGLLIVHLVKWEEVREVREMTRGWGAPGHPIKPERPSIYCTSFLPASHPSVFETCQRVGKAPLVPSHPENMPEGTPGGEETSSDTSCQISILQNTIRLATLFPRTLPNSAGTVYFTKSHAGQHTQYHIIIACIHISKSSLLHPPFIPSPSLSTLPQTPLFTQYSNPP